MATFTSFTSSILTSPPSPDFSDDACSICLEPFSFVDPATITSCKHDYHLHCIIEWSQRSKECPICWQLLSLKDPASQELLDAVEAEKRLISRNEHSSSFTSSPSSLERLNDDHDDPCSDDSDLDEQLMQHLVTSAAASTDRPAGVQPPSQGGVSSSSDVQPPTSETEVPFKPSFSWKPFESARRVNTSEMFSFPDSIKSKFSATSARYKESISRRTRGLKEKLIARNASVKELSKGVKREMNVGIAGVVKMIERLDLSSKRIIPVKGKSVQQNNAIEQQQSGVFVCHISSDSPSLVPPPNVLSE